MGLHRCNFTAGYFNGGKSVCMSFTATQLNGYFTVTSKTHGTDIFEIALATAFDYRNDVIRIPQAFARPAAQAPMVK